MSEWTSAAFVRSLASAAMSLKPAIFPVVIALWQSPSTPLPRFASGVEVDKGQSASVGIGDIDGDGDLDLIVVKGNHQPVADVVLINDGKGQFTPKPLGQVGDRGYGVGVADLDGDGDQDLVVGNDRPDAKVIYANDGRGAFVLAGTFGESSWPTRNITVADLNGDGRPDIVSANRDGTSNTHPNYVCFNDGKGRFTAQCEELSPESATTIAADDMNADKKLDLIVPNRDRGQSYIFLNDGRGAFKERVAFGSGADQTRGVGTGDLNGDGRADIVIGDEAKGGTVVYLSLSSGGFGEPLIFGNRKPANHRPGEIFDVPYGFAVGDVDGDGDRDIVIAHARANNAVLLNDGGGRFREIRLEPSVGSSGAVIADLNGDGLVDIATAGMATQVFFQQR